MTAPHPEREAQPALAALLMLAVLLMLNGCEGYYNVDVRDRQGNCYRVEKSVLFPATVYMVAERNCIARAHLLAAAPE